MWQWIRDKLKGWKTVLVGSATLLTGLLTYAMSLDWTQLIKPSYAPLVVAGLGAIMVTLRFFTTTAIGEPN